MPGIVPNSTIKLYRIDDFNTKSGKPPLFKTAAIRESYFNSKVAGSVSNCTVVKKRYQTLKIPASSISLADLETCTYISFINPSYGNKIFYGQIVSTDYLNNNTNLVSYIIDWWTTDMFQFKCDMNTALVREGLTNEEYAGLSTNPYERDYDEKMRTPEPLLSCDVATEKQNYYIASDNDRAPNQLVNKWDYDGWNVYSNEGYLGDHSNDTSLVYDLTPADKNVMHVICFVVPGKTQTGGNKFFDDINPILQQIEDMNDYVDWCLDFCKKNKIIAEQIFCSVFLHCN